MSGGSAGGALRLVDARYRDSRLVTGKSHDEHRASVDGDQVLSRHLRSSKHADLVPRESYSIPLTGKHLSTRLRTKVHRQV